MTTPVLFDLPGPKARRRIRIGTAVGALVVGAIGALLLVRLAGNGQLEAQRWAVLFDPASQVPQALGQALLRTLQVAIVGMARRPFEPESQGSSSSASGTRVVLPAPGGA